MAVRPATRTRTGRRPRTGCPGAEARDRAGRQRRSSTARVVRSRPSARGQCTSTRASRSAPTCSSRLPISAPSRVSWSGTDSASSRSSTGQTSAADRSAMLACTRARGPNPWDSSSACPEEPRTRRLEGSTATRRRGRGAGRARRGPGARRARSRSELLLVGLDPQRDPDQLGQCGAARALGPGALGRPPAYALREVRRRSLVEELALASVTRPGLNRRGPRQRIGDGIEQPRDQRRRGGRVQVVVGPGPARAAQRCRGRVRRARRSASSGVRCRPSARACRRRRSDRRAAPRRRAERRSDGRRPRSAPG